jgi:hypothetical protein
MDKLNTLRLGRPLVAEVPTGPGRRAFVTILPGGTPADARARREGWTRPDPDRSFTLQHWDYDAEWLDGFDYDIGAVRGREQTVHGESELVTAIEEWGLRTADFRYPWETDAP